jgi:hypothetical protein
MQDYRDLRHSDMHHVLNCLATMSRTDAVSTFRTLSDSMLRSLARQARYPGHPTKMAALNEQVHELFERAAVKLDAQQMVRLARVFDSHADVVELCGQAAKSADATTRVELIAAMAPRVMPPAPQITASPKRPPMHAPDTYGLGVGILLASLKDHVDAFDLAVRLLSANQLACVCLAGTGPHLVPDPLPEADGDAEVVGYEPTVLHGLLAAAARSEDLYLKCLVLDAATGALILMRDDPDGLLSFEAITLAERGLSDLLDSGIGDLADASNDSEAADH